MGYLIKNGNTTRPLLFLLVQSSDHITPLTGATPTVTISKNGGSFASPSGAVTEIGNGVYKVAANATDAGTNGPLWLHATATSGDPCDERFEVVAFDPEDSVHLGISALPNAAAAASGGLLTFGTGSGQINPDGIGNVPLSATTDNAIADALLDRTAGVETGMTVRQALRVILSAMAGKVSGAGTLTVTFRDTNDTKDRITATVDSSGNRTAVTLVTS